MRYITFSEWFGILFVYLWLLSAATSNWMILAGFMVISISLGALTGHLLIGVIVPIAVAAYFWAGVALMRINARLHLAS